MKNYDPLDILRYENTYICDGCGETQKVTIHMFKYTKVEKALTKHYCSKSCMDKSNIKTEL